MKHISWFLSVPQHISDSIQTLLLLAHLAFYCLLSSIKHKIRVTSTIIRLEKLEGRVHEARRAMLSLVSILPFQNAGLEKNILFLIGQSLTRKSLCFFYYYLLKLWNLNSLIKWPTIRPVSYPNIGTASIAILYLWMSLYTFSGRFYSSLGSTYLSQDSCIKNDSYNRSNFKEGHKQNDFSSSNCTGHLTILLLVGVFFFSVLILYWHWTVYSHVSSVLYLHISTELTLNSIWRGRVFPLECFKGGRDAEGCLTVWAFNSYSQCLFDRKSWAGQKSMSLPGQTQQTINIFVRN